MQGWLDNLQFITSPSNARLKLLRKLHGRRQREKLGRVVLEGHRLILDALDAGLQPEFIVLHDRALAHALGQQLGAAIISRVEPERVLRVPEPLVASLSDTETPQGVLAVLPRPKEALPAAPSLVLVCDGVADPGNLGTLLRSAVGAGVGAVLLMPGCSDPWSPKALRAGMGAQCRVPTAQLASWADTAAQLRAWGLVSYAADAGGAVAHDDVDWSAPSALVVGSEAHGLSAAVREDSHVALCRIPLGGVDQRSENGLESLNAAVSGSVILFEAQRQRRRIAAAALSGLKSDVGHQASRFPPDFVSWA